MLFNSLSFLAFLLIVTALFWLLPAWSIRKKMLLVASYVFYAAWNPPYAALLFASTSLDWLIARQIGRSNNDRARRGWLTASLLANLAVLGFFKYGHFAVDNIAASLAALGIQCHISLPEVLLPIGISFYTFASLSYTIDVYRREIDADWTFGEYALFVSFFPHLVAGPIIRAVKLLPQIRNPQTPSLNQVAWGFCLFIFGLFAKTVLADSICAPIVDEIFNDPSHFGAIDSWVAIASFSGQIYFDFSGYSLCAIGLALTFGFHFPDNFRAPYAATSLGDFWRRWHISLSTWLRDYLYVSLGGNRAGTWTTYRNLMLTMLIGGLWHGASWLFVLWGACHGTYLVVERAASRVRWLSKSAAVLPPQLWALLTFLIVSVTWIPFRAADLHSAGALAANLLNSRRGNVLVADEVLLPILLMATSLWWQWKMRGELFESFWTNRNLFSRSGLVAICLIAIYLCSGGNGRAFIYFQF